MNNESNVTSEFDLDNSPFLKGKKILEWKGNGRFGDWESKCEVHLYKKRNQTYAICTDIGIGTSVTNCIELIAGLICKEFSELININSFILIEHYLENKTIDRGDSFSQVHLQFDWRQAKFTKPKWEPVHPNEIQDILTNTYI